MPRDKKLAWPGDGECLLPPGGSRCCKKHGDQPEYFEESGDKELTCPGWECRSGRSVGQSVGRSVSRSVSQ